IDASKTIARIVGVVPLGDQQAIRTRFAKAFRFIVSQRLLAKKSGSGRVAAVEILKSTMRTREYIEKGENEGKTLLDAMRDGTTEGMQHFDGEIEKLIRAGIVEFEAGMSYATNAGNLRLEMADFLEERRRAASDRAGIRKTGREKSTRCRAPLFLRDRRSPRRAPVASCSCARHP